MERRKERTIAAKKRGLAHVLRMFSTTSSTILLALSHRQNLLPLTATHQCYLTSKIVVMADVDLKTAIQALANHLQRVFKNDELAE